MNLDEMLEFRKSPSGDRLLLVKLEDCAPCELLEQAIPRVDSLRGYEQSSFLVTFADKKSMGAVLKAGISDFPLLELYRDGVRLVRSRGVRGGNAEEVARNLSILVGEAMRSLAA